jgi:hypothetical protein
VAYDDAVRELYQAPVDEFVAVRKRLAGELRAAGDRYGASRLAACKRPTIAAWAVNQLYWHARDGFDCMLATAERLRAGELAAQAAHRDAIASLRQRAAALLGDAGHAATEATLRKVTTSLAAVAAAGGFDPDPPGALAEDRAAPGFAAAISSDVHEPAPAAPERDVAAERRAAERAKLETALETARGKLATREAIVAEIAQQLERAHAGVAEAKRAVDDLVRKLEGAS